MLVGKFQHKGLRSLYHEDDARGLPPASVAKVKRVLAAIDFAADVNQIATLPGWKLHPLKGARKGEYSVTITGNWRLTFRIDGHTVTDLNFEDYH